MDISRDKPTGADGNPYIWLRYTTQFSTGGRTHTIEMGIPVPLGASPEMREQLIREAELGMDQLTRRVENRASQMLQRNSRPPEPVRPQEPAAMRTNQAAAQDGGNRSPAGTPPPVGTRSTTQAPAVAREAPQPLSLHEREPAAMPARQSNTVNMPVTPAAQSEANSNMKLSQFMQAIRESWGLTPKQAMDLLNVKTLNGMNYREALRKLQPLVEGNSRETSTSNAENKAPGVLPQKPVEERVRPQASSPNLSTAGERTRPQSQRSFPLQGSQPMPPARSVPGPLDGPTNIPVIPIKDEMIREAPRRIYKFDEEDEELAQAKEEHNGEQSVMARIKLDELKEVRNATTLASQGRLTVLQNVLNSQISDEQLQHLIQHVWGVSSVKKLKVDQIEALVSWAKEDYFVEEVEAVLALIDGEEFHARSDW